MTANLVRLAAIKDVRAYEPPATIFDIAEETGSVFGENVFSLSVMKKRLPKSVFKSVAATIQKGDALDPAVADVVASAMKDWAMEKGVTHYAHVFYPLTGLTAEKHDSFMEPVGDGTAIWEFRGKTLIRGEPDASSFPNGGIRATFEARGYTGWDVQSPAYILENPNGNTLCIPTIFVSMTGEALDHKTPLLRSQKAMADWASRVLELFGHKDVDNVVSYCGPEQEYFPGRLLLRQPPPRPAQRRSQPLRRQAAQGPGVRRPLLRCHPGPRAGVHARHRARPLQARHPGQDAPQRGGPRSVRDRPGLRALQHGLRPPADADVDLPLRRQAARHGVPLPREAVRRRQRLRQARQLLVWQRQPGATCCCPATTRTTTRSSPVFCAAIVRAVHLHGGLLRLSVASAGNDHRLGANEAPPAIISIFLGDQLADVFRPDRQGWRDVLEAEGHPQRRRGHAPRPDQGRRRPQPHLAVRLHRQPLRVPRRGLQPDRGRPDGRHQHDHGGGARLLRQRARRRRRRRHGLQRGRPDPARQDHGEPRRGDLQRQRLLRGVARRGRDPWSEEPQDHGRLAPGIPHPPVA
ncbi:glutamine synthetase III [Nocardioides sp. B-3]|nr:glutamine synthetase III [Nocardioides sp. B-3]UUZ58718.1 glutamine synthetase III [Nocardioides sp. B-3]